MAVVYQIHAFQTDRPEWLAKLRQAVAAEITDLGLHTTIAIAVIEDGHDEDLPTVGVALIGSGARDDPTLFDRIDQALAESLVIVPVVDDLAQFASLVPRSLESYNGFEWSGVEPERRLARFLLEELGIEEGDRRVFISHKRSDGLGAAEQLHDALSHVRFGPFIDRFSILPGQPVQRRVADALERYAFLVILETPEAYLSYWVFDEVDYALAHTMGLLIVQWPGNPTPIPGSATVSRLSLEASDLIADSHGYDVLTPQSLDHVVRHVEAAHAYALVRRRRTLVRSVQDAVEGIGATCTALRDWKLDVVKTDGRAIVGVAPRLPVASDLQQLDEARDDIDASADAVLVHAARQLDEPLKKHLEWVTGVRRLRMMPENGVGGQW